MTPEEEKHSPAPAENGDKPSNRRKRSVLTYLVVLFAAAFLLLLLSYLMQQRSNRLVIDGLRESMDSLQTVELLQERNALLENRVVTLEEQLDALTAENASLREELETTKYALQAALGTEPTPAP